MSGVRSTLSRPARPIARLHSQGLLQVTQDTPAIPHRVTTGYTTFLCLSMRGLLQVTTGYPASLLFRSDIKHTVGNYVAIWVKRCVDYLVEIHQSALELDCLNQRYELWEGLEKM